MKNGLTRRTAAGMLAGMPLIGKAIGQGVAGNSASALVQGHYADVAGMDAKLAESGPMGQKLIGPKMPEWQATRLAMMDPDMKAALLTAAFAQHRVITSIDPDIEVMRSFSPMAKIAFQRQRNVERSMRQATEEPIWVLSGKVRDYIRKLMWGERS